MRVKTHVRAGINRIIPTNHNETLVRDATLAKGFRLKAKVKAGAVPLYNHNETLVADTPRKR
jgi:hypothetical protein